MRTRVWLWGLLVLVSGVCLYAVAAGGSGSAVQMANRTPNHFYGRGTPTFVVGTMGNARSKRALMAQVTFVRGLLFPKARILKDTQVDVSKGPKGWPPNPILYGAPHNHAVLAKLAGSLPVRIQPGHLRLGGVSFRGAGIRLIARIPARKKGKKTPGNPAFLLYASTGRPGIAEINGVSHGREPILVADGFGRLAVGGWRQKQDGTFVAKMHPWRGRRLAWRGVTHQLKLGSKGVAKVTFRFLRRLRPRADEAQRIAAGLRGVRRALQKLGYTTPRPLEIYVHPDRKSKQILTGNRGDGHAVTSSRMLHVLPFGAGQRGAFENLITHEATHIYAYDAWGPPGSVLFGEGLAVWISGQYGGRSLSWWQRHRLPQVPVIRLLGRGFSRLPERQSYPVAGLFVGALVRKVGLQKVRRHLYPAYANNWRKACKRAGVDPKALEGIWQSKKGR